MESVAIEAPEGEQWKINAERQPAGVLQGNKSMDVRFTVQAPENAAYTRPYFTRPNIEQSYYDIQDSRFLNRPLAPYPLSARLSSVSRAELFAVNKPVGPGTRIESSELAEPADSKLRKFYEPIR